MTALGQRPTQNLGYLRDFTMGLDLVDEGIALQLWGTWAPASPAAPAAP
jgi:hypothetical protein